MIRALAPVALCSMALGLGCARINDRDVRFIDVPSARKIVDLEEKSQARGTSEGAVLIDTRLPSEFARERIPGAVQADLDAFSSRTREAGEATRSIALREPASAASRRQQRRVRTGVESAEVVIVYGADPGSAAPIAMAKRLLRLGIDDVYVLQGGFLAWTRQGGSVEREAEAVPAPTPAPAPGAR